MSKLSRVLPSNSAVHFGAAATGTANATGKSKKERSKAARTVNDPPSCNGDSFRHARDAGKSRRAKPCQGAVTMFEFAARAAGAECVSRQSDQAGAGIARMADMPIA